MDLFCPISASSEVLSLPQNVSVTFIGQEKDIPSLKALMGVPYVGMDAEWRPQMTTFGVNRPAIFQLSSQTHAFLIDMIGLANSAELDKTLTEIFMQANTICVGFSFHSDLSVFSKSLPSMQFFRNFTNYLDLQSYYQTISDQKQLGLAKVADQVLKKAICKGEQMSNWEKRPLRNSQRHYAALDAFCLIPILLEAAKNFAAKDGVSVEDHLRKHVKSFDINAKPEKPVKTKGKGQSKAD